MAGELDEEAAGGASNFAVTVEDEQSQIDFGIRWKKETVPSALSAADAEQWGEYILSQLAEPVVRARLKSVELFRRDDIQPHGKMRFFDNEGVKHELPIARVSYSLKSSRLTEVNVDLGDIDFMAIDKRFVDMIRTTKKDKELQGANVKQLSEV